MPQTHPCGAAHLLGSAATAAANLQGHPIPGGDRFAAGNGGPQRSLPRPPWHRLGADRTRQAAPPSTTRPSARVPEDGFSWGQASNAPTGLNARTRWLHGPWQRRAIQSLLATARQPECPCKCIPRRSPPHGQSAVLAQDATDRKIYPPLAAGRCTIWPFSRSSVPVWRRTMQLVLPHEPLLVNNFQPGNCPIEHRPISTSALTVS